IDRANRQTRINWTRDMVSLFEENSFGYAYWSYKEMDFGLVDQQGNIPDQELVDILVGR
ncbi:MAG: glycoside hydrolase family 5 protein, partial [Chloroflexi bacterium]|nr:glycoside hydrolase family 5 protein [Chloroflexota bacterium]